MLEDWDPYHMWMAMYTRYIEPGDDFYFYCYDCVYYNNVGSAGLTAGVGYSVLVAHLDPFTSDQPIPISPANITTTPANLTITGENSTVSDAWVNDPSNSQAVATYVFNNYCVSGIQVQKRRVNAATYAPTMFDRFLRNTGTEHILSVWAV
jgi:hypothetical protein